MTQININILHGNRSVGDDDRSRAKDAALKALESASVTVADAYAEFQRQWAEFDDYGLMTGLAAVWIEAEQAADLALTAGWANPDGASCSLSA
jgi:hypothetical protein